MDTNKDGTLTIPELESSLKQWLWQDVGEKIDTAEEPFGVEKQSALAAALLGRANFTGLVLGCIEAKFCRKICV